MEPRTSSQLSFRLSDLGLDALAKKCDIKGRHWGNLGPFDQEFLDKADLKLESMERGALLILRELRE